MNREEMIAETREQIQKWFDSSVFSKKISDGTATIEDIDRIAKNTANILVTNFKRALGDAYELDLPLGEDVIRSFLPKAMENNYDFLNTVSAQIQSSVDLQKGLRIKAQKVSFPAERVDKIAAAAGRAEDPEKLSRIIDAPVRNVVDSFTDDYVRVNADFRSRAGLETHIVRRTDGSCCEWCSKLAGKYRYPDEVPKDVFRRHDNCTCTVTYINGKNHRQVWSKRDWNDDEEREYLKDLDREKLEKRKKLAAKKPVIFTQKEAAERERRVRERHKKKVLRADNQPIKYATKSELDKMSYKQLKEETTKLAKRWYTSGKSGISFGKIEPEAAAEMLAYGQSRTSLTKDYISLKKHLKELDKIENSGIIKENIVIGRSVGAAGKNYPIRLPSGNHTKIVEGTEVTGIKTFAGKGTATPIRVADQLEEKYGVKADKWEKVRGTAYIRENGINKKVEIHWYEAEGQRVEMKVKRYYDES